MQQLYNHYKARTPQLCMLFEVNVMEAKKQKKKKRSETVVRPNPTSRFCLENEKIARTAAVDAREAE